MNSRLATQLRTPRGFTVAELIISVVILAIIAAVGVRMLGNVKPAVTQSKLQTEVIKLNQIAAVYLSEGGSFDGLTSVQEVVDKLKTIRSVSDARTSTSVMTGRGVDVRLVAKPISSTDVGTSMQRVVWDSVSKTFKIATTGTSGATEFYLDDSLANHDYGIDTRAATAMQYNGTNGWAWADTVANTATNYNNASQQTTTDTNDNLFDPNTAPPASTLPTPKITPVGGSFTGAAFPSTVTISANGAPGSGSSLKYQVTHTNGTSTSWAAYTGAVSITYGDTVSAKNVSTNATRYFDSAVATETYTAIVTTLPTPIIVTAGGSFPKASFPSTVGISINGAPGGTMSTLQYRITSAAGAIGAWTTYGASVTITYGDKVEARNLSNDTNVYTTSAVASQTYTLQLSTLPTPVNSPTGGSFTGVNFPSTVSISTNGAPTSGSQLQYRRTTGGVAGTWTVYSAPVTIAFGDTIESKNVSTDNTLYADSTVDTDTYTINITTLPTPVASPTGTSYPKASFPSTVSLGANGAPGSPWSTLQYRITPSGGSAGAWTNYASPIAITYGDKVQGRNLSNNTSVYTTSNTSSDTYTLQLTTLPTPINSPTGGTFTGVNFPASVTISSNGAPGTGSQLQYRRTTGGVTGSWTNYTSAVAITYGDKVESRNLATDTTLYATGSTDSDTYNISVTTLPTPVISPTGGSFPKATFPATATISANGAPAGFYTLQYRVTPKGGSAGAWTTYTAGITIAYGDKIEARNLTTNASAYNTSNTTSQTYILSVTTLPTPTITPTGGGYPKASFPASVTIGANGAPGGTSSVLKYRRTTGGVTGAWTTYSSAVAITYGDTIEAQNVALDVTLYADSAINSQTYTLTTTVLPTPIITPPGGAYPKATFPSSVTISANGAPGGSLSVLKYRRTTGGVTGAWTNYTAAVSITYGDTVEAQNVSLDTTLYTNSGIASETYTLLLTTLPTPINSPSGGAFTGVNFPTSVTVSANGATGAGFTLQYRKTTGGVTGAWTTYSAAIPITYGDSIESRNLSTDATLYITSASDTDTYTLSVTTLPTPIITPTGGAFPKASFPATATISSNGAPGGTFSVLQYRVTNAAGTVGAWTTYSAALTIAYGDKIEARNLTQNTTAYNTSATASQTYTLSLTTLPTPIITPTGGTFTAATFPTSVSINKNGAPASGNVLQYQITHADSTTTAWTTYTAAFTIAYGDTVAAKNTSTDNTLYVDSATTSQNYKLNVTTLPTPVISPTGGSFPKASFPATATISANSAPAGYYTLQYRVTNSVGTVGSWTTYSSAITINYGDMIEARNLTTNSGVYNTSATTSQTYVLTLTTLPTPVISPTGGTFTAATFPSTATISSNGAPGTGSQLQYQITHSNGTSTAWTVYSTAIALTYGDTLSARNLATDTTLYSTSATTSQTYNTTVTTLPTPVITPAGGTFTVNTMPATVTISANGAPSGKYTLQYQIIHSNGSSTSWTNYVSAISITYGDTVSAKNATADALYADSSITNQTYAVTAIALPTPIISPTGGSFPIGTFPSSITISSNGAPGGTNSQLQYQITHTGGSTTAWATYTAGFAVANGDTVTARNVSLNTQLYTTSSNTSQTYLLLNTFTGSISPTWTNVGGGPGLLYTINNSNPDSVTLKHGNTQQDLGGGQIIDAGIENVMTFNRASFSSVAANTTFNLGTLVILNGTTFNDSEATSATLHLSVSLTQPVTSTTAADLNFTMVSTANSSDRQASADYVTLSNPNTSVTVTANGITYTLQLSLVSTDTSNGWVQGNTFYIYEGASATATLQGKWVPN